MEKALNDLPARHSYRLPDRFLPCQARPGLFSAA